LIKGKHLTNSFFIHIYYQEESFPDLQCVQIAIIGLTETRGMANSDSMEKATSFVREKLYALNKGNAHYKIVDLGNLRRGVDLQETNIRITTIGEDLMKKQILPIYIGGSHDLDYGQYLSYARMIKLVTMLTVDAKIDMEDEGQPNEIHAQEIILHQPNLLFNYCHLAYQSFQADHDLVNAMEKLYFDHVRLGQLRDNFKEVEPLIRNADLLSFDMCAIQSADAP